MKKTIYFILAFIGVFLISCNPCKRFFTYKARTVNVKGITTKLKKAGAEFADIGVGEINIKPEFIKATDRLQELDLLQFTICGQIKSLPKNSAERNKLIAENVAAYREMLKIIQDPANVSEQQNKEVKQIVRREYGPFSLCKYQVETKSTVNKGELVEIVSEGTLDFGGAVLGIGAPIKDANGDNDDRGAPSDYPAPSLIKNSLIVKVGGKWYQGGVNKSFRPDEGGTITLFCNDRDTNDNSRGWSVKLYVTGY